MPLTFTVEILLKEGAYFFRPKTEDESIEDYRKAYADKVQKKDVVEAHEIRTGRPWNKWTDEDKSDFTKRAKLGFHRRSDA
jgi:hypothetical protein